MASKRETVISAVLALVENLPGDVTVKRNEPKPQSLPPGGLAILRDGDPGEPTVDLSPLRYNFQHRIPLEVAFADQPGMTRDEAFDAFLVSLGAAVEGDRGLGGLCDWLDVEAPEADEADIAGAESAKWADVFIVAQYATSNPLT
jgi:hypothetical protein